MPTHPYARVLRRVERRVGKTPYLAILHAALYTALVVPIGLLGILFAPSGAPIDGFVYLAIMAWSVLLGLHLGAVYLRSGLWPTHRERIIREEISDAGETDDLNEDEMVAMHRQLSQNLDKRARPYNRIALSAVGNLLLWPGGLVAIMFFSWLGFNYWYGTLPRLVLFMALVGTGVLGLFLPLGELIPKARPASEDELRALYARKGKRDAFNADAYQDDDERAGRLTLSSEGEFVIDDAPPLKRKGND